MTVQPEGRRKSLRERLRVATNVPLLFLAWGWIAMTARRTPGATAGRACFAIVPADVRNPLGSKGDEAMIVAVSQYLRRRHPNCEIIVPTVDNSADDELAVYGLDGYAIWKRPFSLKGVVQALARASHVYVVGADIMDGYYSTITSLRLWMIADLLARRGRQTVVGGFSFNSSASWSIRRFLANCLSRDVEACVRDGLSLGRFRLASRNPGRLVADVAFRLVPAFTEPAGKVIDWIDTEHARGRLVVGLNLHPMLIPDRDPEKLRRLVAAGVDTIRRLTHQQPISVVLIPHDFRLLGQSDLSLLLRVFEGCKHSDYVILSETVRTAPEIKAIAGACDLVVTGRMHLAIAALGSDVPTVVIEYQDKFAGLMEHVGLPQTWILRPDQVQDAGLLYSSCIAALAERSAVERLLGEKLLEIEALSNANLLATGLGAESGDQTELRR